VAGNSPEKAQDYDRYYDFIADAVVGGRSQPPVTTAPKTVLATNANGRKKVIGRGRGKGGGPPSIEIDTKVVEAMAHAGSPNVEIAEYLGISVDTLTRRCAEILAKRRAGRKSRLRQLQTRSAENGNVVMQIWLGKQELGQRDKAEVEHSTPQGDTRQFVIAFGQRIEF